MKTFFISIFLLVLALENFAQTSLTIILKTDIKIDSVSVMDISQKEFHSLSYRDTLTFNFRKNNVDCYNIRYSIKQKTYWKQAWLNSGRIIVNAHLADASHLIIDTVLNSPVFYGVIDYLKQNSRFGKDTVARNKFMLAEIEKNLENTRSIAIANDYINFNQNSKANLLKLKMILSRQKDDFSWFIFYDIGIKRIDKLLEIRNLMLSNFKFIDRKNEIVSIKLNNYNYYLLDFWFVGCVPCMKQHIEMKSHLQELNSRRVKIIGISIDNNQSQTNKYLLQHGYSWSNYLQSGKSTLSDYLGIQAFPAYVLLNSKGDVLSTFGSLRDVFEKLMVN